MELGPYRGDVAPGFRAPELLAGLAEIAARLPPDVGPSSPFRRSRVARVELAGLTLAVKAFGAQGPAGSRLARRHGSKARRSWDVACAMRHRGVPTPAPVAVLERWDGGLLKESYFVSVLLEGLVSFKDALIGIYRREPRLEPLLALLEAVAAAVRGMHEGGIQHGDLGNQNVLLRRTGPAAWGDVVFLDVNRGAVRDALTLRERAFDHSRIRLPSDLRRIFQTMAFGGHKPPVAFLRWEAIYRARFWVHTRTRALRHPIRMARLRRLAPTGEDYPRRKDLWIWDERTGQAIGTMRKLERYVQHPILSGLKVTVRTAFAFVPTWRAYFRLKRRCFAAPVAFADRVGMTISPRPDTVEAELALLDGLGRIPVLMRYYHHETRAEWDFTTTTLRRLHERGHPVSIALVQDRRAVTERGAWRAFVEHVLAGVGDIVEYAEVGHGINRVKWGIWSLYEYLRLLAVCRDLQDRYPGVGFLGPAVYDFEYHYVASAVWSVPRRLKLAALSLHLYVDRRGAPENRQYSFSTVGKCTMARALAHASARCEDRVVVTEVNWPLRGTGVWSPVTAPYQSKDPPRVDPNVSEDEYADYMVRYLVQAISSGMVERVYWWRLVARGFGLVDDDGRKRPAYEALRLFLDHFGRATFLERMPAAEGVHLLRFDAGLLAYASEGEASLPLPAGGRAIDALGAEVEARDGAVRLTGRPVYVLDSRS